MHQRWEHLAVEKQKAPKAKSWLLPGLPSALPRKIHALRRSSGATMLLLVFNIYYTIHCQSLVGLESELVRDFVVCHSDDFALQLQLAWKAPCDGHTIQGTGQSGAHTLTQHFIVQSGRSRAFVVAQAPAGSGEWAAYLCKAAVIDQTMLRSTGGIAMDEPAWLAQWC